MEQQEKFLSEESWHGEVVPIVIPLDCKLLQLRIPLIRWGTQPSSGTGPADPAKTPGAKQLPLCRQESPCLCHLAFFTHRIIE